eukprot:1035991-Prymnesium_polylepis.1
MHLDACGGCRGILCSGGSIRTACSPAATKRPCPARKAMGAAAGTGTGRAETAVAARAEAEATATAEAAREVLEAAAMQTTPRGAARGLSCSSPCDTEVPLHARGGLPRHPLRSSPPTQARMTASDAVHGRDTDRRTQSVSRRCRSMHDYLSRATGFSLALAWPERFESMTIASPLYGAIGTASIRASMDAKTSKESKVP